MTRAVPAVFRRTLFAVALALAIPCLAAQEAAPDAASLTPPPLPAILLNGQVHAMLKLDASQEALWQALDRLDVTLQGQSLASRDTLRRVAVSELSKAAPNLVLIEAARAYGQQGVEQVLQTVNNYASSLYASLTEEQRGLVATAARSYYQPALEAAKGR